MLADTTDDARTRVAESISRYFAELRLRDHLWKFIGRGQGFRPAFAFALQTSTGVGKTEAAILLIADYIRTRKDSEPVAYFVPQHRLGDEIVERFKARGINARVFRGREADNPDSPGEKMCLDPQAVKAAIEMGESVSRSCCKGKDPKGNQVTCPFFERCAYQHQKEIKPDVWVLPHDYLFHKHDAIGTVGAVFIDESFWQRGIWGPSRGLSLDEIEAPIHAPEADAEMVECLQDHRRLLAQALRTGKNNIRRQDLVAVGLTPFICSQAKRQEWALKQDVPLYPGMSELARKAAMRAPRPAKHVKRFAGIWDAARQLLEQADENAVSGRLFVTDEQSEHGRCRVVRTQGVRDVAAQWRVPTLIMDATLPDVSILQVYYPTVEVLSQIDAPMPHASVRQVLGAPVSANKLKTESNKQALRRYLIRRWKETGCGKTLVVAQKVTAEWLKETDLPEGMHVEHFNNIAGLDRYGDTRLLISVGRTMPKPHAVEGIAGALSGIAPKRGMSAWYDKTEAWICTATGAVREFEVDYHPDPLAEAVRWQICEGENIQGIGRARGVNRTADNPIQIDILADMKLPLTLNDVFQWDAMPLSEKVLLESPTDMATCWPEIWPTRDAAKGYLSRNRSSGSNPIYDHYIGNDPELIRHWTPIRYRPVGEGQQWRKGLFGCSNPRSWIEQRIGALAEFEIG